VAGLAVVECCYSSVDETQERTQYVTSARYVNISMMEEVGTLDCL
jgi:hypothetical protein